MDLEDVCLSQNTHSSVFSGEMRGHGVDFSVSLYASFDPLSVEPMEYLNKHAYRSPVQIYARSITSNTKTT